MIKGPDVKTSIATGLLAVVSLTSALPGAVFAERIDDDFAWSISEARDERGRLSATLTLGIEIGEEVVASAVCEARSSSARDVPLQISVITDGLIPDTDIQVDVAAGDASPRSYRGSAYAAGSNYTTALIYVKLDDPLWSELAMSRAFKATATPGNSIYLVRTAGGAAVSDFIARCRTFMGG